MLQLSQPMRWLRRNTLVPIEDVIARIEGEMRFEKTAMLLRLDPGNDILNWGCACVQPGGDLPQGNLLPIRWLLTKEDQLAHDFLRQGCPRLDRR